MRRRSQPSLQPLWLSILCAALFLFIPYGLDAVPAQGGRDFDAIEVEVRPVQGNVFMLAGAGGNITVQVGDEGVLVVDTQFEQMAPKIMGAIRTLSDKPIRYIINTHVHRDHAGGNEALATPGNATIIAHENVLKVMRAPATGRPLDDRFRAGRGLWPTETYTDRMTFSFNGEEIEVIHIPTAHSTGDSLVFFRGSNVIVGGDVFAISRYPIFDFDGGGRLQGMIQGLNQIIALAAPTSTEGRTYIVPGHGRVCDVDDVIKYRNMTLVLRDRVENLVHQGRTLDEVQAAKPTWDYDPLYGSSSGLGATDNFVEDLYRSLTEER